MGRGIIINCPQVGTRRLHCRLSTVLSNRCVFNLSLFLFLIYVFNLLHVKKWNTCPKRKKELYVTAPDRTGDEEKSQLSNNNEEENVEGPPKVNLHIPNT